MRWRTGGSDVATPRWQQPAAALGVELAGATRHGELRRGAHHEEGEMGIVVLTQAAIGREGNGGGDGDGGGEDRVSGGGKFRLPWARVSVSTGWARTWRCRIWARRRRCGLDGAGDEENPSFGRRGKTPKLGACGEGEVRG